MITKDSVEAAYCFFHQKWQVYDRSTMAWQRDDIEYAIDSYTQQMSPALYAWLADGRMDFLRSHDRFAADMAQAVARLEQSEWFSVGE
ncbi:hypothetical protein [Prevotella sp.]|uniref:hypothetical protein n=1 Tax=Prevotella sp. TaxID=59823 RepID=UPI002F94C71F